MGHNDENISPDERRISELIGLLRHVDAPADFTAGVRSRIADKGARRRTFTWTPVLAGSVALVVLAFAVYLGVRTMRPGTTPDNVAAANEAPSPAASNVAAPAPQQIAPAATQGPAVVASSLPAANTPAKRTDKNLGGSVDEALSEGKKFFPRGVDPRNSNVTDARGVGANSQIPVTRIFGGLGIDAAWNGSGWQVNSVTEGSLPERSGLRTGDVIESIDGKPLGERTVVNGTFSARTLHVRRDGKAVDIPFKP
jgi:C-terminal processing protease CtpA/Prc